MQADLSQRKKGSIREAERCLQCYDAPCAKGCPAGIEVDRFIRLLAQGDICGAAAVIEKDNPFGLICGYICPSAVLCQKNCTSHKLGEPLDIKAMQCFATEAAREMGEQNQAVSASDISEQRFNCQGQIVEPGDMGRGEGWVAVIGAGPGGITAALYLRRLGYEVEIFEASLSVGGRLSRGIPAFRVDKQAVAAESDMLSQGIKIHYEQSLGRDFSIEDLRRRGFDGVYIAIGNWREKQIPLMRTQAEGIYKADDILLGNAWQSRGHKKAAIIGAGNVAMDVARTLLIGGIEQVNIFFIAANAEIQSWPEEREEAFDEGAVLHMLAIPQEIIQENGRISALKLSRAKVNTAADGCWSVEPLAAEFDFVYPTDMVVFSIGYAADKAVLAAQGLELAASGAVKTDAHYATNLPGVYAGGDLIGSTSVVQAVGDAKQAAYYLHKYIMEQRGLAK